eukprot:612059_1
MGSGVDTNPSLDLVVVPHIANVLPPEEIACLKDLWIFGYGSLVWRPEFDHVEKRPARLEGYKRRFWQGSHDHRGTHTHPGRVVTLLPCSDSVTWGMAYRVGDSDREKVLSYLDVREKNGYSQVIVDINFPDECGSTQALVYIATECNVAYLGPAPVEQIADQIMKSHGLSGVEVSSSSNGELVGIYGYMGINNDRAWYALASPYNPTKYLTYLGQTWAFTNACL